MTDSPTYTVFMGQQRLITAPLRETLTYLKQQLENHTRAQPLVIFNDQTGKVVDFNLQGTLNEVLEREAPEPAVSSGQGSSGKGGPGRPKLGVVSREISLLPRHWDWLESHPNGASATLRRLIDEARKANPAAERKRQAILPTDRFLIVMGGDLPGAEEASRALYNSDHATFQQIVQTWPEDIRNHVLHLSAGAFEDSATGEQA